MRPNWGGGIWGCDDVVFVLEVLRGFAAARQGKATISRGHHENMWQVSQRKTKLVFDAYVAALQTQNSDFLVNVDKK